MPARPAFCLTIFLGGLVAMLLVGCSSNASSSSPSTTTTTKGPKTSSTSTTSASSTSGPPRTGTTPPSGATDGSGLQFRAVISSQPCSSVTPEPPADGPQITATTIPATTVPAPGQPQLVPAAEGSLCYRLGPSAASGTDLTRAVADPDAQSGGWTVLVSAKDEGKVKLNTLFDACYAGAATCPAGEGGHGSVAIELDGKVVSAPAIQSTGLASSPFQIVGTFTPQQAKTLAARLNG